MKNVYEIDQGTAKEDITTLFTFSAAGLKLTPLNIYPYKRIPNGIRESIPDGFPVILFLDVHNSHLSLKLFELCTQLNIVLISLPPDATRIMQPADLTCFKPAKSGWSTAVTIWKRPNPNKILTKARFARILGIVVATLINKDTIENGFRACGLCPFDANAVDYTKCLGKNRKGNVNAETKNNSANIDTLPLANAIDLQRFREIFGPEKLLALNQFYPDEPCTLDFALLHKMFEELSPPNDKYVPMSDEAPDIEEQLYSCTEVDDTTVEQENRTSQFL